LADYLYGRSAIHHFSGVPQNHKSHQAFLPDGLMKEYSKSTSDQFLRQTPPMSFDISADYITA